MRVLRCTAIMVLGLTWGASGAAVRVVSYSMPNGESPWGENAEPHYWDDTYNGSGNKRHDLDPLSGGTGKLTDGVAAPSLDVLPPWVGWMSVDPTITFNFDGTKNINTVTLHLLNNRGSAGISLPKTIR